MTITAAGQWSLEDALREETDLAEIGREFSEGVQELVEESRAEARAAGRQYRLIHRLWQLQEEAREQRWAVEAHWMPAAADRLGPHSLEPEEQTLQDVADEIGPALRLPAGTALRRVEDAVLLGESLPAVLEALEHGVVGVRQAGVIVELWRELVIDAADAPSELRAPAEAVGRIADELLDRAPNATVAQLRALARRRRAGLLRETEEQRHRLARRNRRVWVEPREDGMAQLCALLDAATAHAIQDRIETLADRSHSVPSQGAPLREFPSRDVPLQGSEAAEWGAPDAGDGVPSRRTLPQIRADVLADLLLDGEPADLPEHLRGIRGHVTVTVPVLSLLSGALADRLPGAGKDGGGLADTGGESGRRAGTGAGHVAEVLTGNGETADVLAGATDCAELEGYGPVPVGMAERIAARAPSWSRILTCPVTGTVLDRDRTTYAVPADLKHRLRARDGTCRFPGCRRRAARCDLDHTVAWADGGRTAADNLAHLCRHHHLVKHRKGPLGRWRVEHVGRGSSDLERPDPDLSAAERSGPLDQCGVLEWTSPAGQVHRTYPQEYRNPAPVGGPQLGTRPGPQFSAADDRPPF
ncbi:DUF222 domain-containing protein [Kocuria sediminis]|uniref:DUF222 domain-containing protein n=1 Tax=Kocuria sediminis TaxID=1038857 RepID=A0A6N8GJW2_9MICC|nr:HNH endonuclease signature motif containing protein [Kocuria sediminis]MUN63009.1 DUF222 domain-containing protein [Kocuria sediminis]